MSSEEPRPAMPIRPPETGETPADYPYPSAPADTLGGLGYDTDWNVADAVPTTGAPAGAAEHGPVPNAGWSANGEPDEAEGILPRRTAEQTASAGTVYGSGPVEGEYEDRDDFLGAPVEGTGTPPPASILERLAKNSPEGAAKLSLAVDRVAKAKKKLESEAGAQWRRVNRFKKNSNLEHHYEMQDAQTELRDVLKQYADAENLDAGERIELSVEALDKVLKRQVTLSDPAKKKAFAKLRSRIAGVSSKRWVKIGVPAAIVTAAVVAGVATGGLAAGGFAAVALGTAGGALKGAAVGGTVGKLQARAERKRLNTREATQQRTQHQRRVILDGADKVAQNPGLVVGEHEAFTQAVEQGLYGAATYERRLNISDRKAKVRAGAGRGALYGAFIGGTGALAGGYNLFTGGEANASEAANAAGGPNGGETITGHRFIPGAGDTSPTPTPEASAQPTPGATNKVVPGYQGIPRTGDVVSPSAESTGNQGFKTFDTTPSPNANASNSPYQGIPRSGDTTSANPAFAPEGNDHGSPSRPDGMDTTPSQTPIPEATSKPAFAPEGNDHGSPSKPDGGAVAPNATPGQTTSPTPEASSKPAFAPEGNDHGSPSKPDGGATTPNNTPNNTPKAPIPTTPENPAITNAQINGAQEKIIEGVLQNDPDKMSKVSGFENFTPEADTKEAAANFKNGNTLWDKLQDTGKLNDGKTMNTIIGEGANKGGLEELSAKGFNIDMGGDAQLTKGDIKFSGDTWWVENMKTPDGGSYVTMPNGDTFYYEGSLNQNEQAALLDQLSKGGEVVSPETMADKMAAQIPDTPEALNNMGNTLIDGFNTELSADIDKAVDPNETNPTVIQGQKMNAIESFIAEHKQTLADLPENLQDGLATKIAQANNVPPEAVKKLIDDALETAATANSSR